MGMSPGTGDALSRRQSQSARDPFSTTRPAAARSAAAGWLGAQAGDHATPIMPSVLAMPASRVLCVQGVEEGNDSLCAQPSLSQAGVEIMRLPGGHHYDQDYAALALRIIQAIRQRSGATPSP